MQVIKDYHRVFASEHLLPNVYNVTGRKSNQSKIINAADGAKHEVLNFASNDFYGFSTDPRVTKNAINAIKTIGVSTCGAEALNGRSILHQELEQIVSELKGLKYTHLFSNAWMAIAGLLNVFCHLGAPTKGYKNTQETLVMFDSNSHACIVTAAIACKNPAGHVHNHSPAVHSSPYSTCNADSLRQRLERKYVPGMRIIVLTDSVFSMDGNIAPLPELLEVLKDYPDSTLVVDEAHATGTIGATGKGIFEHFNLTPQDAINMGINPVIITTFSKFAGSAGAAISSNVPEFIKLLKYTPTSIGTIAMAPSLAAGAITAIKLMQEQPHLVANLHENTRYFRQKLKEANFETIEGTTPVIPVITKELHPKSFAHRLLEEYKI